MVELEDFKYGGTNITSLRLVDPGEEKVSTETINWRLIRKLRRQILKTFWSVPTWVNQVQSVVREWIQGETWHSRQIPFSGKTIKVGAHITHWCLEYWRRLCQMMWTMTLTVEQDNEWHLWTCISDWRYNIMAHFPFLWYKETIGLEGSNTFAKKKSKL